MDKSKKAVEIFDKLANEYQAKFMDIGLYSESFDIFCLQVKRQNADVLEIACGPGNITKYLLSKRPDFNILGIDLAGNMLRLAKLNNPAAEFQLMDCRDIVKIEKKFDAIMCGFCLPYLNKQEALKFIADAYFLLKPGGIIYISTMEDDYSKSGYKKGSSGDEIFMHYHQADYLTAALVKNNFFIIDLQRKEYPARDEKMTVDLLILAGKAGIDK